MGVLGEAPSYEYMFAVNDGMCRYLELHEGAVLMSDSCS